jgi:riboflavin-specific deaminase-like protein
VRQLWPERRAKVNLEDIYGAARHDLGDRPWLALNMVTSVDGATTVEGASAGLSGPGDRTIFHLLRAFADIVLVGAGTVRLEAYGPASLDDEVRAAREARGQKPEPRVAIVTRTLDVDFSSRLFTDADEKPLVITSEALPAGRRAAAGNRARILTCGEDEVDLAVALGELHGLGARFVLCEGGPTLNGTLLAAGLVDEVCSTVAPMLVGGDSHRFSVGGGPIEPPQPMLLDCLLEDDGLLFFRWLRREA